MWTTSGEPISAIDSGLIAPVMAWGADGFCYKADLEAVANREDADPTKIMKLQRRRFQCIQVPRAVHPFGHANLLAPREKENDLRGGEEECHACKWRAMRGA